MHYLKKEKCKQSVLVNSANKMIVCLQPDLFQSLRSEMGVITRCILHPNASLKTSKWPQVNRVRLLAHLKDATMDFIRYGKGFS